MQEVIRESQDGNSSSCTAASHGMCLQAREGGSPQPSRVDFQMAWQLQQERKGEKEPFHGQSRQSYGKSRMFIVNLSAHFPAAFVIMAVLFTTSSIMENH